MLESGGPFFHVPLPSDGFSRHSDVYRSRVTYLTLSISKWTAVVRRGFEATIQ
jgi:hypothetical protein